MIKQRFNKTKHFLISALGSPYFETNTCILFCGDTLEMQRSYAKSDSGKSKAGYYLTINFEKIQENDPKILLVQMGWLNHSDWVGQKSETGQQAALTKEARENKFIILYKA
jgi:hypothetical protein